MSVQIQPQKPKDPHNGFAAIEADLVADDEQTVVAIVTYRVAKVVKDKKNGDEYYPVLYMLSIEPLRGDLEAGGFALREAAHKARTGSPLELDFDAIEDHANSGDGPGLRIVEDDEEGPVDE